MSLLLHAEKGIRIATLMSVLGVAEIMQTVPRAVVEREQGMLDPGLDNHHRRRQEIRDFIPRLQPRVPRVEHAEMIVIMGMGEQDHPRWNAIMTAHDAADHHGL